MNLDSDIVNDKIKIELDILRKAYLKAENNEQKALILKNYIQIKDSIQRVNLSKFTNKNLNKYKNENDKKEFILSLKQEEAANNNIQVIIIALSFILLTTLIIGAIIIYYFQSKNKQSEIVSNKLKTTKTISEAKLIESNTKIQSKKSEKEIRKDTINGIVELLESSKSKFKTENHKVINSIIRDLKRSNSTNNLEEFEVRFQNVTDDFEKKLLQKHPNLTPNEKKICSFLKLNMTSKEISNLTSQSIHSIEVARTRLRKKLNLSNSKVKINYYLNNI